MCEFFFESMCAAERVPLFFLTRHIRHDRGTHALNPPTSTARACACVYGDLCVRHTPEHTYIRYTCHSAESCSKSRVRNIARPQMGCCAGTRVRLKDFRALFAAAEAKF